MDKTYYEAWVVYPHCSWEEPKSPELLLSHMTLKEIKKGILKDQLNDQEHGYELGTYHIYKTTAVLIETIHVEEVKTDSFY
jgi:hypothetical protein